MAYRDSYSFQGDWRVQAVNKTFNLIVGQELSETAYGLDGNPITVSAEELPVSYGLKEDEVLETTTNKILPFKFESKITSGAFRGASWTNLIGDLDQPEAYAQWALVQPGKPLLYTPLRMKVIAGKLPDGITIVDGDDLDSTDEIPYITGAPTEEGGFVVSLEIWAPNNLVFGTGNEPLFSNSADGTGDPIEITEYRKDLYGLDLEASQENAGMYIAYTPRAIWKFAVSPVPAVEEDVVTVSEELTEETTDEEGETTKETKTVTAETKVGHKWEQFTLGQNKKIQEVVASAAKAAELVNTNIGIAKTGIQAAQLFLTTVMNPKVMILNTIADAIDNFVNDFLGTGFYILEVVPTGQETVPKSADGNPIALALAPAAIVANYSVALAAGLGTEFTDWTTAYFGKADPKDVTASDAKEVPQGKSKPLNKLVNDANSDRITTDDNIFGLPSMTPSQVISTMMAAIDDPLDANRPTFSVNTEVGAIVMVFGFSSMSVNVGDFRATIQAMVDFFGGEQGMFTEGMKKMANIVDAATGGHEDPTKHDVTVNLVNVSGVYGTEDDIENLKKLKVEQNFKANFSVNDFVVGPRLKYGRRVLGYISKADKKNIEKDDTNDTYVKQKVTIRGATETDYLAWKNLSGGAQIQRAHFFKSRDAHVDQNTSEIVVHDYIHDFKLFDELPFTYKDPDLPEVTFTAETATTKVERKSKKAKEGEEFDPYLSPVGNPEKVIEKVGEKDVGSAGFQAMEDVNITKDIVGTIVGQDSSSAPPPNFKNATLEDLIGDFKTFFLAMNTFADQLRDIAKDTSGAIKDLVEFLDGSIKQLDKINEDLQKVLKLFSVGLPDAGVYVLVIPPDGVAGVEGLKAAISAAENQPPSTLSHSVGFLMVGDKASAGLLTDLLAP